MAAFIPAMHPVYQKRTTGRPVALEERARTVSRPKCGRRDISLPNSAQGTWRFSSWCEEHAERAGATQRSNSVASFMTDDRRNNLPTARETAWLPQSHCVPALSLTSLTKSFTSLGIGTTRQSSIRASLLAPLEAGLAAREDGRKPEPTTMAAPKYRKMSRRSMPEHNSKARRGDSCFSRYCTAMWLTRATQTRDLRSSVIDGAATTGAIAGQFRRMLRGMAS